MEEIAEESLMYGWDATNEKWIPIQVDADGKLVVTI